MVAKQRPKSSHTTPSPEKGKSKPARTAGSHRATHIAKHLKDCEEFAAIAVSRRVLAETSTKYGRKIYNMRQWLQKFNLPEMTPLNMRRMMGDLISNNTTSSVLGQYRAAWKFWSLQEGKAYPAEEVAQINAIIQGVAYNAGEREKEEYSPIDSGMLEDLRQYCMSQGRQMYADGFAVIWYGVFRHTSPSGITGIRVQDVRSTNKGTMVRSTRKKAARATATSTKTVLYDNLKAVPNLEPILKALCKGKGPDDLLFPKWSAEVANKIIKAAAQQLQWGEGKWCVYSLRHGAAIEMDAACTTTVTPTALREARRAGWSDVQSKRYYGNGAKGKGNRGK